jgi:hypothetical protein
LRKRFSPPRRTPRAGSAHGRENTGDLAASGWHFKCFFRRRCRWPRSFATEAALAVLQKPAPPLLLALLLAACSEPQSGAARLAGSLESIANEMMSLHEPQRIVEYHDRTGKPFWIGFIAPGTTPEALAAAGVPQSESCPASPMLMIGVGGEGEQTQCVPARRVVVSTVRAIRKEGGATVRITLDLDVNGVRIVDVR